jgi:hypothetical protein
MRRRSRSSSVSLIGLLALLLPACGGSTAPSAAGVDGGTDAQADAAAPVDAPLDSPLDAPAYLACMDAMGLVDVSLKACKGDSDCVIEQEQADCCGTILYVGLASASVSRFAACEASWVAHFPGCGCDSGQTKTEDGKVTYPGMDAGAPEVGCVVTVAADGSNPAGSSGVCMTFTP